MTDNEIIKALECCKTGRCISGKCAFYSESKDVGECMDELVNHSFDLINRQKAEIEKLKSEKEAIDDFINPLPFKTSFDFAKKVKSESIREFGKFLIDKSKNGMVSIADIPEYVNEMTEGKNGKKNNKKD